MAGLTRKDGLPNVTQLQAALVGTATYLGEIISTTVKNNSDTAVPFVIPAGALLLCSASADVQYLGQALVTGATTTTNGIPRTIAVDGKNFIVFLGSDQAYLSCVGAATTKVWHLG